MNLQLTPVVKLETPDAEDAVALQARISEAAAEVDKAAAVIEASRVHNQKLAEHAKFLRAHNGLNRRAAELLGLIQGAESNLEAGLVGQFVENGRAVDVAGLVDTVLHAQAEHKTVIRVLQTLVEDRIPVAHVATLGTEADLLRARAAEFERLAHERFAKTTQLLREAATYESGLAVDIRSTFSGRLLDVASDLFLTARQRTDEAKEKEKQHLRLKGGL